MRTLLLILVALLALASVPATAQPLAGAEGTVALTHWPPDTDDALAPFADLEVLPFLDTLTLGYKAFVEDDHPVLSFALSWVPGDAGILDGRRVPAEHLPEDVRMTGLDVELDVFVGDTWVTDLVVTVDSMTLSPVPYVHLFTIEGLTWEDLFADVDPAHTREAFAEGLSFRNMDIVRIGFSIYEDDAPSRDVAVQPRPRPPSRTTIYVPHPDIWVIIARDPYRPPPVVRDRPNRPRGDTMGRGRISDSGRTRSTPRDRGETADAETSRGTDRGETKQDAETRSGERKGLLDALTKNNDDEEDDEETLLPAALLGVAAVGVIAFAGGTVGYYGHPGRAPIGLSSGFVRPQGGILIQVAVNEAVLGGDGPEHLTAQFFGFFRYKNSPVLPAIGAGVWANERGGDVAIDPSLSLGLAYLAGPVVLHGGYDVAEGSAQIGLAFNFRHKRR